MNAEAEHESLALPVLGREADAAPMDGLLEWHFSDDAGVQVWKDPLRAGHSTTVVEVADLDDELNAMLAALPVSRHVFTNATEIYAWKVLAALGVSDLFERVFGIEYCDYVCKPNRASYERILKELGLPAGQVAFVEDNPGNLGPARDLGMVTVLVGNRPGEADLRISSILHLGQALSASGLTS